MTADDRQPWRTLTSSVRIIELHDRSIQEHGGAAGPMDAFACVDGATGAAYNAELYLEGKKHAKSGLAFAAYLLVYIVQRHCFVDGNKRTAWASCADVLAALGLGILATDDEAFSLMEDVIAHRVESGEQVASWLAPGCTGWLKQPSRRMIATMKGATSDRHGLEDLSLVWPFRCDR
jgi:death-on-curing protein